MVRVNHEKGVIEKLVGGDLEKNGRYVTIYDPKTDDSNDLENAIYEMIDEARAQMRRDLQATLKRNGLLPT